MADKIKYNNYPLNEIVEQAGKLILQGLTVYQKFTCDHCGSRQTMEMPNSFHSKGICEECKLITDIEKAGCNYMVHAAGPSAVAALMKDIRGLK